MGSGTSKPRKSNSASTDTRISKNKLSTNQRSISVPSYSSSLKDSYSKTNGFSDHSIRKQVSLNSNFLQNTQTASQPTLQKEVSLFDDVVLQNEKYFTEKPIVLEPKPLPSKTDIDESVVMDQSALTVSEVYNILVAETWQRNLHLTDNSYLLLLDCRNENAYSSGHIVTARHVTCLKNEYGCLLDTSGQIKSFQMIILYDNNDESVLSSLKNKNSSVYSMNSSFSVFRKTYPFLCTESVYKTVEERKQHLKTWPSEVLAGKLFQGNAFHALDRDMLQTLGITHVINVTRNKPNAFPETISYMRIQLDDEVDVDLYSWLAKTSKFIQSALFPDNLCDSRNRVLVHCNYGRSRSSTVVLAFLMESFHWSLQTACDWLKDCRPTVQPNVGFLNQLMLYEKKIFGREITDFHQISV